MHIPPHFKEESVPVLHETVRRFGFGTLVTMGDEGLEASHVPMLIESGPEPFGTLHGHIARANLQWKRATTNIQALAIFQGPNAYITPSSYPTKKQTGKVVPTWNYVAVHAYGPITFYDDPSELRMIVTKLTETHESNRLAPWNVADAPTEFIELMLKGIVGFKLAIARLEGKWKLSQNRSAEDASGVCDSLRSEGRDDMVALMASVAR